MSHRALSVAALALGACGSAAPARPSCTPPARTGVHAQAGPFSVTTDRARVTAGASVTFTVLVTGPARYQAPCDGPVQLLVSDSADQHVYSDRSAAVPGGAGVGCGDISLADGQRQVYSLSWRPEVTLPPGAYTAVLLTGDQPALTVPLIVDAGLGTPSPCR